MLKRSTTVRVALLIVGGAVIAIAIRHWVLQREVMHWASTRREIVSVIDGKTNRVQFAPLDMIPADFRRRDKMRMLTEMYADRQKAQEDAIPLARLCERLRRGDTNAVAGLVEYANDERYSGLERGAAVQVIERLGTREALMIGCGFLTSTGQVRTSAFYGLPSQLQNKLLPIYERSMTSEEFSNALPTIVAEVDAYLASEASREPNPD